MPIVPTVPIAPINVEWERPCNRISCRSRWHVEGEDAFLAEYRGNGKGGHDGTFTILTLLRLRVDNDVAR